MKDGEPDYYHHSLAKLKFEELLVECKESESPLAQELAHRSERLYDHFVGTIQYLAAEGSKLEDEIEKLEDKSDELEKELEEQETIKDQLRTQINKMMEVG